MGNNYQPEFDISVPDGEFKKKLAEGQFAEKRLESILGLEYPNIEVKDDIKFADTGNLFIETGQSDGRGGKKSSGINVTRANWWVVWLTPEAFVGIVPTRLKEYAREYGKPIEGGDNGNTGRLIRLNHFFEWLRNIWRLRK